MTTRWLQWFSGIWLACSLIISVALLYPVYLSMQEETDSGTTSPSGTGSEASLVRSTQRLKQIKEKFAASPNLENIPVVQAIRSAAAGAKVTLQIHSLPPTGAAPQQHAELQLVAQGSLAALAGWLEATEQQLSKSSRPLLGIDSWSIKAVGKQNQADLTLWTLIAQSKK